MTKAKQWEPDSPVLGYDPRFASIDTRGLPLGSQLENLDSDDDGQDPFLPDGRFGQLDETGIGLGSKALKKFIGNLDQETIQELSKTSPELAEELRQAGLREFHYSGWLVTPVRTTGGKIHCTAENADREEILNFVIKATDQDTLMEKTMDHIREITGPPEPQIRDLSESELLFVQRQAQSGDMRTAIVNYLKFRIGDSAFDNADDPWQLLTDPRYKDVCDDAAYDVWRFNNNHYVRSEEFESWLRRAAEDRPLTVEVINAQYIAWLDHREQQKRSALLNIGETPGTEASTPATLDDLSGEQISDLRRDSLRELARQHRAGRGR